MNSGKGLLTKHAKILRLPILLKKKSISLTGLSKLASVPAGGAVAVPAAAGGSGGAAPAAGVLKSFCILYPFVFSEA